jgi:carbamoyl-phosphate synthase large subunit
MPSCAMINILVTAVGSELAFSIIKAINLMKQPYRLIGCDIYPEVVGKYWCDRFYTVPPAINENEYINCLMGIVAENKVDVIIPSADTEFLALSKYKTNFKNSLNCDILVNDHAEIEMFNDKWLAYQWYLSKKIATPKTFLADNLDSLRIELRDISYPLILKPRVGGGSRQIFKINTFEDVVKYLPLVPCPIIQEYLFPDDAEYTAGTYRNLAGKVLVIVMKRTLKFGMTNTAEVTRDASLEGFCRDTMLNTNLTGSNNIQFRITEAGPKILEINPRFSGTTGIRASFGFNDVEMWIDEIKFNKSIHVPQIKTGFVLRYMHEQYHFSE